VTPENFRIPTMPEVVHHRLGGRPPGSANAVNRTACVIAILIAATLAAYWKAAACDFVTYDDYGYVVNNPMVNQGLRPAAICWAFIARHSANWHPLTSLSHMLDCSLFGLSPAPAHWENVLWHTLNTVLVFLAWQRLSRTAWPSAFVAALFALHPLRVESVAWISERKDVLSTALWLLTLLAYARYMERPSRGRYSIVALGLALGLMAKPMVVSLPFTLLLLDCWPLRRWPERNWRALVFEKLPLFALAVVASIITLVVQRASSATDYGTDFSFGMRLGNALVSCVRYLGKTFWPAELSPFYPHPGWWPWWAMAGSAALLGAVSWLAWRERERRPWLAFGWAWYLVTLLPVLGIVQVGAQSIADRYTYVPLLGIFTILAWAGAEVVRRQPRAKMAVAVIAVVALAACLTRTVQQIPIWENGLRLTERMRAVGGEHPIILRETAAAFIAAGRPDDDIIALYRRGLEIAPRYPYFRTQLAISAARAGRFDEACALIGKTIEEHPDNARAHDNLGTFCFLQGRLDEAIRHYRRALDLQPDMGSAHRLLAQLFRQQGRLIDARDELREAIRCDRWDWQAHNELGELCAQLDQFPEARDAFERAHWIHPADDRAHGNLVLLRQRMGLPNPAP